MKHQLTRRNFTKTLALGAAAAALPISLTGCSSAQAARNVKIGHTAITWTNDNVEQAIKDVASLGFHGFETFGRVLEQWEEKGGLGRVLEENNIPLISAYCGFNMTEPDKRKDAMEMMHRQATLLKKYGGKVVVLGPNQVKRDEYNFAEHKNNIVEATNEVSKMIADMGLTAAFHQHTGTCVESREETYAVMEAVDTNVVKFGPDIGQLQKGGVDPVPVVRDFLEITQHMHLKDWNGGEYYLEYAPLGEGQVNLTAILDMMEGRNISGMVMVELDGQHYSDNKKPAPESSLEAARKAKTYLQEQGVQFSS